MKKLISLSSLLLVAAPAATVVSCEKSRPIDQDQMYLMQTFLDNREVNSTPEKPVPAIRNKRIRYDADVLSHPTESHLLYDKITVTYDIVQSTAFKLADTYKKFKTENIPTVIEFEEYKTNVIDVVAERMKASSQADVFRDTANTEPTRSVTLNTVIGKKAATPPGGVGSGLPIPNTDNDELPNDIDDDDDNDGILDKDDLDSDGIGGEDANQEDFWRDDSVDKDWNKIASSLEIRLTFIIHASNSADFGGMRLENDTSLLPESEFRGDKVKEELEKKTPTIAYPTLEQRWAQQLDRKIIEVIRAMI